MKVYFSLFFLACIGFVFTATIDKELLRELIDGLEGLNRRQSDSNRIYIGNLPYEVTDEDLREVCEEYGKVTCSEVVKENGQSRGFGFAVFANHADAEEAIATLDDADWMGRQLRVHSARRRGRATSC